MFASTHTICSVVMDPISKTSYFVILDVNKTSGLN